MNRHIGSLLIFLVLVVGVSAFGSQFGTGAWYAELAKPAWNPPSWVFAPVWSILYLMIAASAWLVWKTGHEDRGPAIAWWSVQLVLNGAWSWLFFGLHRMGWALLELALLILAVVITLRNFHAIRPLAAFFLLPFLAWIMFAWALNLALWTLNGGGLNTLFI